MSIKGKNTVSVVEEILEPIVKECEVFLWDVVFEKEGASWFLRVYIDKDGGIDFNDCENVSRALDKKLDEIDPIEQSYFLEVSSTGLERKLTRQWHFDKYNNHMVTIKTIRPINGDRDFVGVLVERNNTEIILLNNHANEKVSFNRKDIVNVRLFEEISF